MPTPTGGKFKAGLEAYLHFYNTQRPHQALGPTGHRPRCSVETRCNQMNSQKSQEEAANARALVDLGQTAGPAMTYCSSTVQLMRSTLFGLRD